MCRCRRCGIRFVNGERQLVNAGRTARTDDLGAYRIFGLMPGDYIVRASMLRIRTQGPRGVETEQTGYPGHLLSWRRRRRQAQTVTVALGQELSSIAFPLVPARLSRISGTVMGSDGRPLAGAIVMIRARGAGLGALRMNFIGGGGNQVRPDGSFQLTNVPPGDYVLDVQQRPRVANRAGAEPGAAGVRVDAHQRRRRRHRRSHAGDDTGRDGLGTRRVSGTRRRRKPDMQVTAAPPSGGSSPIGMLINAKAFGAGRVNQDGTFELRGLAGPQMIRVQGLPAGWAVKSVTLDGSDVTDVPFDFKPGTTSTGLVVTLTDRLTEITGNVRDARGQPIADYVMVVFSEDAKLWGAQSRHVQTTRPNQNGTFSIKGLPPGRYLAAVVPSLENGMQNDPAVLEQLRTRARRIFR